MPTYYFNLFNDETCLDREGIELSNDSIALQRAAMDARAMAAESVSQGHLVLHHRVEVRNERGEIVGKVHFRDVVTIKE